MDQKAVSLPDLSKEKRRNTALSLSEGFSGANRHNTLTSTAANFARRPAANTEPYSGDDGTIMSRLNAVLPLYYRTRQIVLQTEKSGRRAPQRLLSELKAQEKAVGDELRPLHPLLFQRFDSVQMDRLLRAMPILKISQGRWVFGEDLADEWPIKEERAFLLLYGRVKLMGDPRGGGGDSWQVTRGAIFGENKFKLCDEGLLDHIAGSAFCEEPCIIGCLSIRLLQTAFSDRYFGNKRIAMLTKTIPAFSRIVQDEEQMHKKAEKEKQGGDTEPKDEANESNAVLTALTNMSKVSTPVHVPPGHELLMAEQLDETILMVARGAIEIRGDVTLTERLEKIPAKKTRVKVYVERAAGLSGDSWLDKLDPYCIVKLGEFKRFQTPVLWNVGPNPKFEYNGVLQYKDEPTLEFTVMDHDAFSADDLCGSGSIKLHNVRDGERCRVQLKAPKQSLFNTEEVDEEDAGWLFVTINFVYEKANAMTRAARQRTWENQVLFTCKEKEVWGQEQIMLRAQFRRTLENASNQSNYALKLGKFHVQGAEQRGSQENVTCWKVTQRRFLDFIKHCGREKQFMQSCRVSALEKQTSIKDLLTRLVTKWEQEEMQKKLRSPDFMNKDDDDEVMDPSVFRNAYNGCKCTITVRNALNLQGGSFFDKLDPYATVRFDKSKQEFKTSVLQDAGSDPVWDCEGGLIYNGATQMEIKVYDYDKYSAHDLIASAKLQVEEFSRGFEGMVRLNLPGNKKKKNTKQMMIVIGVQWDSAPEPNALNMIKDQMSNTR